MANLRNSYGNGAELPALDTRQFSSLLAEKVTSLKTHSAASDLLIMFGTDHMEPSPATSSAIEYANSAQGEYKVIHSTLPDYIAGVRASIQSELMPVVKGELRSSLRSPLLPGVLSARIWIKQDNQACQSLLEKWAEPFSVFAERTVGKAGVSSINRLSQPASIIRQAWRLLMENHPHDSICGCSIDQVHNEMKVRFDQVKQIGEEITRQSLASLADSVVTDRGPQPGEVKPSSAVVVFNPSSNPRTDLVNVEINLPAGVEAFDLMDDGGAIVPHESLGFESADLANLILDRKGLREAMTMVNEGRVSGMGVQSFSTHREGKTLHLELLLSDGEPNHDAWQRGVKETTSLLEDETLTSFHVQARALPSNRILFPAPHIPALGYRTFYVYSRELPESTPTQLNPAARLLMPLAKTSLGQKLIERFSAEPSPKPPYVIENEFFTVEADSRGYTHSYRQTGWICCITTLTLLKILGTEGMNTTTAR